MHLVARHSVSVPDEPAHVEAEGKEAGPQQVTQSGQVGDGEVIGVHASAPHPVDQPVCQVEKDHHLKGDQREVNAFMTATTKDPSFACDWLKQFNTQFCSDCRAVNNETRCPT